MDLSTLGDLFKAVGDPIRLRLLHLLCLEELSVGELVRILELPQSTVSRHLKTLREQGLVADRPSGAATFYRASLEAELGDGQTAIRDTLVELMRNSPLAPLDKARLDRALAARQAEREEFFDRIGLSWDSLREECFGPAFHLEAFLSLLPSHWTVADLGTGTGYLLPILARRFGRVIAVDSSRPMLELARRRVEAQGFENVDLREGPLEKLPIEDGELDLAVGLLMMHHLSDVPGALAEMARCLKPGGRALLVEIEPHTNEAFRAQMSDRWPGISPQQLAAWMQQAGLGSVELGQLAYTQRPEHELAPLPRLYSAVGQKEKTSLPPGQPSRPFGASTKKKETKVSQ